MNDFNNAQVIALPDHLKQYVVAQDYARYTPVDQAVWRYVMRQNYHYLKDVAYYPYIPGLKAAGLTIEKIPDLQEMNDALDRIGWGAVTVDGFIPPSAFMEFQANRVLVIAADIRTLEHIDYTPAPDIIHESAGHAPIIADPDYHRYLSYFGSIGIKAISSAKDMEVYNAIRELSILKESATANASDINALEDKLKYLAENMGEASEMALLSRLHWWTVEYGLIGTPEDYKIFGAGLLSSIGESTSCMQSDVKKLVYDLEAVNYAYDITKPQPQLFVTPNFQKLISVLEQFADTMAFRKGGASGLKKAVESGSVCTVQLHSGIQIAGRWSSYKTHDDAVSYIQTIGPTQLAYDGRQLTGHDKTHHAEGFGCPVGKLKGIDVPLEYRILETGAFLVLHYVSGIIVMGVIKNVLRDDFKNLVITLTGCTVIGRLGEVLFDPAWGFFDLAIGEEVVSVYAGAADKTAYQVVAQKPAVQRKPVNYDKQTLALHDLYRKVRECREKRLIYTQLIDAWETIKVKYPNDWLCTLEILEILTTQEIKTGIAVEIRLFLESKMQQNIQLEKLIGDGLALINTKRK